MASVTSETACSKAASVAATPPSCYNFQIDTMCRDLIIGKANRCAVATLTERTSRRPSQWGCPADTTPPAPRRRSPPRWPDSPHT